jgi:hypothetical protein
MAYGTVKVDNVTFTYNAIDATTTFSGFYASTTNNLTLSGTASAVTFTGTTANFTNINAQNIGVTTSLSGLAITGNTAGFTTLTGTTVTGTTLNFSSGIFTGNSTAAAFLPTGSTVPTNGLYLSAANSVAISTNSTGRLTIDSSGNINIDSGTVYVDAVNNRFGIGTTSPGAKLQINQNTDSAAAFLTVSASANTALTTDFATLGLQNTNTTNNNYNTVGFINDQGSYSAGIHGIYTNHTAGAQSGEIAFGTRNAGTYSERLRITSAGLVGIGTSSPSTALDVSGEQTFSAGAAGWRSAAIKAIDEGGSFKGSLAFYTHPSSGSAGAPTERLRIDSSGRVGIGTTSPSQKLDVNGNINLISSGNYIQKTFADNTEEYILRGESLISFNPTIIYRRSTNTTQRGFIFGTHDNNGARVDLVSIMDGRLLIGTIASPAHQLQLSTDSAGKPSTNTWTIVSDERIKEEIELADLDLCYEAVKNIPLKRFKWRDEVYTEEQVHDRHKLGWIAQDVEAVFPKAVRQHEFKYNQVFEEVVIPAVPAELDVDGNVITEEQPERIEKGELISEEVIEDCRDLNSDQLYAAMYGAIQKLIAKVETLEAEIAALKG